MKVIGVVLFVAVLGASAAPSSPIISPAPNTSPAPQQQPSLADAIRKVESSFRRIMPCGAPELGLPPLAPYRNDRIKLNISESMLSFTGEIRNLVVTGMDKYIIIDLSTHGNRTTFDVVYEGIDVLGEFDTHLYENLAGFEYRVSPRGLLNIHLNDVRINGGVTITKNIFGGMNIQDIEYYIGVGDVLSEVLESQWSTAVNMFFNKYVRDTTLLVFDENRQAISDAISVYLTAVLNAETVTLPESTLIEELVESAEFYDKVRCHRK